MSERSLSPMSFGAEARLSLLSAEGSGQPVPELGEDSISSFSPPRHRRPRTQLSQDTGFVSISHLKRSPSDTRLPTHPNPGERLSTLYTSSSFMDSRTLSYPVFGGPQSGDAAEGSTFDNFRYEQSVRVSGHWSLGPYPTRTYCATCKAEVGTQVTIRQSQQLPAVLRFIDDFIHCCRHRIDHEPQELVHACALCKRILARVILE